MNIQLITLSNDLYKESREKLVQSAYAFGIENVVSYDFEYVKQSSFYKQNEIILSNKKFMGYWLWKPFIISESINKLDENDILIYIDAGSEIISSLAPLIEICNNESDIIVCGNANDLNIAWTKRDCFVFMECDTERYWYSSHCDASFMMFRKTSRSLEFIAQWLAYGTNPNIITNLPNASGLPNLPEYIDHRYDQSILSILAEKFEIPLRRVPSQFGNHYKIHSFRISDEFNCINQSNQQQLNYYYFLPYYNSLYGQILNHHRKKSLKIETFTPEVPHLKNAFYVRGIVYAKYLLKKFLIKKK